MTCRRWPNSAILLAFLLAIFSSCGDPAAEGPAQDGNGFPSHAEVDKLTDPVVVVGLPRSALLLSVRDDELVAEEYDGTTTVRRFTTQEKGPIRGVVAATTGDGSRLEVVIDSCVGPFDLSDPDTRLACADRATLTRYSYLVQTWEQSRKATISDNRSELSDPAGPTQMAMGLIGGRPVLAVWGQEGVRLDLDGESRVPAGCPSQDHFYLQGLSKDATASHSEAEAPTNPYSTAIVETDPSGNSIELLPPSTATEGEQFSTQSVTCSRSAVFVSRAYVKPAPKQGDGAAVRSELLLYHDGRWTTLASAPTTDPVLTTTSYASSIALATTYSADPRSGEMSTTIAAYDELGLIKSWTYPDADAAGVSAIDVGSVPHVVIVPADGERLTVDAARR